MAENETKKEIIKHAVDCLMAFFIAFLSAMLATEEITIKVFGISLMSSLLIGIIKFREFYSAEILAENMGKKVVSVPSMFF